MSQKQGSSNKVKNAGPRRGVKPGDKILNRKGGGTPPSQTITSPVRIEKVQLAILKEALVKLNSDNSGIKTEVLKGLIGLPIAVEFGLNEADMKRVTDAFDHGVTVVKDAAKLPEGTLKRAIVKPEPRKKPVPQQKLQVSSVRRILKDAGQPTSQIARIMAQGEAARKAAEANAPEVKAEVKTLPANRDTASMAKVVAASRKAIA